MAKKQKTKAFSFKGFDNKHYRLTEQYTAAVGALFSRATREFADVASKEAYNQDKPFSFEDYPKTKAKAKTIITNLAKNITTVVEKGSRKQWLYACQKNDEFVASIMDTSKLKKARLTKMQDWNLDALQTFQQRKVDGMNLSQRVWKYVGQYKDQIELGIDVGLGDGRSAAQLSQDLRQNLQDPDLLFRRVRDKRGNLVLSKAAKAFHPGQGVYRSSYKNAMRLTRSEINMAYRESDWLRWQQLDFVVGFEVHRSNHEPEYKCNLCDRLVGKYPKTFKFKGWHPQCRCYMTAILMDDDFDSQELSDLKSALYGKEYKKLVPKNAVTDFPQGFKDWVAENKGNQAGWRSTPYFIRDNFVNGNLADGLKYIASVKPTKPIKPVKTGQQKADIQARWNTRVTSRKYSDQLQEIKAKYGKESDAIANLTGKINNEIQSGTTISKVDSLMNELSHKMQVKAAWDERVEINNLETLLVGVKALKTKFDVDTYTAEEKKFTQARKTQEAMQRVIDQLAKLYPDIPNTELAAIHHYTKSGGNYRQLNRQMNKGTLTDFNRAAQTLIQQGLEKAPVYNGTVYRGMIIKRSEFERAFAGGKGDIIKHNRFVSSSMDSDVGLKFAMHTPLKNNEISVFVEIKSKTGRDISGISEKNGIFDTENQKEVLFMNNTDFEITSKNVDSDGTVWLKFVER